MKKTISKLTCLVAIGGTSILSTSCGTSYRVHSVINTEKPYATAWAENLPYRSIRRVTDPEAKQIFINPYTYNPSAIASVDYKKHKRNVTYPLPKFFREYPSDYLPVILPANHLSLYTLATETTNREIDREYCRNELQNAILQVAKDSTAIHLSELKSTENGGNLLLGAATIGLSGGASVASATAARALAASAAGTAGARSLFNEQVYRQTFVESTIALIEKDQADFAAVIARKQTNSINDYTVEAAIMDAKEYENRGSFYHGLALLQAAVQNKINGNTNFVVINQYTNLTLNVFTNKF